MIYNVAHLQQRTITLLKSIRASVGLEGNELSKNLLDECRFIKEVVLAQLDEIQLAINRKEIELIDIQRYFSKPVIKFFKNSHKHPSPYDAFIERRDALKKFLTTDFSTRSVHHTNTLDFFALFNGYFGFLGAINNKKISDFLTEYKLPFDSEHSSSS